MTTIPPLPRFNIKKRKTRRQSIHGGRCCHVSVVPVAATDFILNVSNQSTKDSMDSDFCGEPYADNGELLSTLWPLLFNMKLFGLYFHREQRRRRRTDDPEWKPAATTTSSTWLRVYATVVLILMCLNAIRFATIFNGSDHFGTQLLMKIMMFTWFCLAAIFQTAYYYASHTGRLVKILVTLPVTRNCVRSAHRCAINLVAIIWITLFIDLTIGTYFYFDDKRYDFMIAPFVTHINVPEDNMTIARVFGYIIYLIIFPGVYFSHGMNQLLGYILYSEYKKLKRNFRGALGERGQFTGDLSIFRRRHQTLSRAVSKVDGFVKFGNVAEFVCHTANIILLIYSLIFLQESRSNAVSCAVYLFWLAANISGLFFSANAAITINHMVCIMYFMLYCVHISITSPLRSHFRRAVSPPLMVENGLADCMTFGKLLLRKIIKIVIIRCHFKAKMHEIDFGALPQAYWGSLQRSPDLLAGFRGPSYF